MLKRTFEEKILNALKFIDPILVVALWSMCYWTRFVFLKGQEGIGGVFFWSGLFLVVLSMTVYSREGLYSYSIGYPFLQRILKLFKAQVYVALVFIVFIYFVYDQKLSRSVLLLYFSMSLFFHTSVRFFFWTILTKKLGQSSEKKNVIFIGSSYQLNELAKLWSNHLSEFKIIGWVDGPSNSNFPVFQSSQLKDISKSADLIVLGLESKEKLEQRLEKLHNSVTPIYILPEIPYSVLGFSFESMQSKLFLKLNQPTFSSVDLFIKRMIDLLGASVALLLLSPLLALIAIAVKLSSPGPILFTQERIGMNGRKFKMLKFRSMKVSAESESTWTTENDPRRTAFGTFLRKSSLDELPQLWNIFVGEMSIVGPRPEQPFYVEKFKEEIPAYMLRHKMKAGLTGWAQVNGWRGDTDLNKRIECDLFYIRNWSLWFDVKIIFLTVIRGFFGKNAY